MNNNLVASLLDFIDASPTPFHAVANMAAALEEKGFERLEERSKWRLQRSGRYYVTRGGSSIVAFRTASEDPVDVGVRMVGAHTDSPCLRIKPQPDIVNNGYLQLGVEVYGSALLNPWFDRDLSVAGRVTYADQSDEVQIALIDYREPIAIIPNLAIHLDREANSNRTVNPQQHLPAIVLCVPDGDGPDFKKLLQRQLERTVPDARPRSILDFELSLYDTQPPQMVGLNHDFIASARLDNLLSCYVSLRALVDGDGGQPALLVCNDHEEVGSQSAIGAQGPFLRSVLERWCGGGESYQRLVDRSMLVSADNAHGVHPNYADKHDKNHAPRLNGGPVVKINYNQRYATNSVTSGVFRQLCEREGIPVQVFVTRSDLACGSTIGPLTAGEVGVRTVDLGVPQFAMHSVRELCGVRDIDYLHRALTAFYASQQLG